MDATLFFFLGLIGWGVIILVYKLGDQLLHYWKTQQKVKQLDAQIWALESGADKVSYNKNHGWLDLVILAKDMNFRVLWRAKNVTTEVHFQYKSYTFTYSPIYYFTRKRVQGTIIQFKDDIPSPHFAIFNKQRWKGGPNNHENSSLALSVYSQAVPKNFVFVGKQNDSREIYEFLQAHHFFQEIIAHPQWDQFYVRDNFVAVYFQKDKRSDSALNKEFFAFDTKIARIMLGELYQDIDPAEEIRILKGESSHQNRD